jgi:hypothetical protein
LQHVARTAETLPIETSVAETELEQTDVALQKLNDMLTRLDRLPTDGVQEGQLNELSKQKQQVNSAIERVRAWRDALIRQLEALRQWHDDQTKCQSDATQICRQAQQLCDRYRQGPQPLQVGMDDLKAAENLQTAIWDQQKVLQVVMDRVCGQLPDPRKQAEEVERLKGEMNESSTNLKVCEYSVHLLFIYSFIDSYECTRKGCSARRGIIATANFGH